mmetsp:Transcript_167726/g.538658  ORF Transcript_167726/g.538658 Transcript_167726/m.538658 type:complete len:209 (-) Transcript_167726:696-1322(-)
MRDNMEIFVRLAHGSGRSRALLRPLQPPRGAPRCLEGPLRPRGALGAHPTAPGRRERPSHRPWPSRRKARVEGKFRRWALALVKVLPQRPTTSRWQMPAPWCCCEARPPNLRCCRGRPTSQRSLARRPPSIRRPPPHLRHPRRARHGSLAWRPSSHRLRRRRRRPRRRPSGGRPRRISSRRRGAPTTRRRNLATRWPASAPAVPTRCC